MRTRHLQGLADPPKSPSLLRALPEAHHQPPAPAPPGTLRIPGEPVNFPYRILNTGACMICIGGAAESETSDACTACLEPRCTRRKQGAQKRCATEGGRVPKRSSSSGQWSGPWDACGGVPPGVFPGMPPGLAPGMHPRMAPGVHPRMAPGVHPGRI